MGFVTDLKIYIKGLETKELGLMTEKWRKEIESNRLNFFRQNREWSEARELAIELAIKELKSRGV